MHRFFYLRYCRFYFCTVVLLLLRLYTGSAQSRLLVFQSDFGLKDGAVAAMKGVAAGVSPDLKLFDLTHDIPAYHIWEAAYRLRQTAPYWPVGTVFVSVVDPGVGSSRRSVVLKTKAGHYYVTPDNGTLTLVAESEGISELREIDEQVNRRSQSGQSYTFHGRDVYAYTGARLAAGVISFAQVGPKLSPEIVRIPYPRAMYRNDTLRGTIPVLDIQYGNVRTNIDTTLFSRLHVSYQDTLAVEIRRSGQPVYTGTMPYVPTFSAVAPGQPLCYLNSLLNLSFALNEASFAAAYQVNSGPEWEVLVYRQPKKQ